MSAPPAARPRHPGIPAWLLSVLQALLLATTIVVCFRSLTHAQSWAMAVISVGAATWAVIRPDSLATALWLLIIGVWWLTGYGIPGASSTLLAAVLTGAVHYLTGVRANAHRSTRMSPPYLAGVIGILAGLSLAILLADLTIRAVATRPATSELWVVIWGTTATLVLVGFAVLFTRDNRD